MSRILDYFRCLRGFQGRRCERKSLLPPGPTKPWSDTNTSGNSKNGGVPHEDLGELHVRDSLCFVICRTVSFAFSVAAVLHCNVSAILKF